MTGIRLSGELRSLGQLKARAPVVITRGLGDVEYSSRGDEDAFHGTCRWIEVYTAAADLGVLL